MERLTRVGPAFNPQKELVWKYDRKKIWQHFFTDGSHCLGQIMVLPVGHYLNKRCVTPSVGPQFVQIKTAEDVLTVRELLERNAPKYEFNDHVTYRAFSLQGEKDCKTLKEAKEFCEGDYWGMCGHMSRDWV